MLVGDEGLDPTKSEFICMVRLSARVSLAKIASNVRSLSICGTAVDSADVVRDLGVTPSPGWGVV